MDRKEVSAILLKARETIESCDKTISEVKEVHRKSAEELRRMSDILSTGSFRSSLDLAQADKQPEEIPHEGVTKVSFGPEEAEPVENDIKTKRRSRKKSSLASMLRRNFTANYDLSSLQYSLETLKRDDSFKREDARIKPTPLILVAQNDEPIASTKTKTAQERRQSFAKSNMSRHPKIC